MPDKRFEILDSLPAYGEMYVPVSPDGIPFYSEGYAVRFYKSDGTDWVANFQPGWSSLCTVEELEDIPHILVVAFGNYYVIDPDSTIPLMALGPGYKQLLRAGKRIILHDDIFLTILEADGNYYNTERISIDGIDKLTAEGNVVKGLSFNPLYDADIWLPFTYNLETKVLEGGSFKLLVPRRAEPQTAKPWWKIW